MGKHIKVVLRDVSSVDEAGRDLLSRLAANGCRLQASGTYNSYMIQTLQSVKTKPANATGNGHAAGTGTRKA